MDGACLILNDEYNGMMFDDLNAASKVTKEEYAALEAENKTPFPNNFNLCNIAIDDASKVINGVYTQTEGDCVLPPTLTTTNYVYNYKVYACTFVLMMILGCLMGSTR